MHQFSACFLRQNGVMTSPHSLSGIRVLDLSRVLAGPWCTQTLADLGADVIKIERPDTGDDTRTWGPPFLKNAQGNDTPQAAYYLGANRNKRSVTCDIAQPAGQALIRELAVHCDVLVENFKVGNLARYGLDYESIKAINPRMVYCSVTGFGQTGPYADQAGYDYAIQGMGGLMSVTGERDDLGGGPQKVGVAVADLMTGMYATVGILAALRHAEKTGVGQHVDMALLDTQVAMLANLGANYLIGGEVPGAVANVPELGTNPLFALNRDRVKNRAQLVPLLETVMRTRSKADWLVALEAAKVPCGAINNLAEVFVDPQIESRGMVTHWNHPDKSDLRLVSSPIKLSATPVRTDMPPPLLGQHTDEVLRSVLNYTDAKLSDLKVNQVI